MLPLLLEPEALEAFVQAPQGVDYIIVDVGQRERYESEHIPGAVLVTPAQTQAGKPIPGLAPDSEALTNLVQSIGLKPDTHVIVYDDEGGGWAGRFIWLLDEIGHRHYSYLNGGLIAWKLSGLPDESGAQSVSPSDMTVSASGSVSMTADQLQAQLDEKDLVVWDARSPEEYRGEKMHAARGGHIPGACNYEWTQAMDMHHGRRLKPLEQLRQELKAVGIDADKRIVAHCQSHHRSGLSYLIGKLLEFREIKAYPGSWGEWGNDPKRPIEI